MCGHSAVLVASQLTFVVPWQHHGETMTVALHQQSVEGEVVLYVHGATFPSALAVGWMMQGVSWMDDLQRAGFDAVFA